MPTAHYGKCVVAGEPIAKGTRIYNFRGEIFDQPTMHTIQLDDTRHINCTIGGPEFTSHSCDPTGYWESDGDEQLVLIALRDIGEGEQISMLAFFAAVSLTKWLYFPYALCFLFRLLSCFITCSLRSSCFSSLLLSLPLVQCVLVFVFLSCVCWLFCLAFNYLTTEWDMSCKFTCLCGSKQCFGEINGYKYLDDEHRLCIDPYLSPYIRSRAAREMPHLPSSQPSPSLPASQ